METEYSIISNPSLTMEIEVKDIDGLPAAALRILQNFSDDTIFAFYGDLGAGKTTLIKELCVQLGVEDETSSPTFAIYNEYFSEEVGAVYHFDFYRINTPEEALDIGVDELFYSNSYCFIEWPEKIDNLLPDNYVRIKITAKGKVRTLNITR
jgi:tRNA threonylcarbamoyladenosine biosynthesis protein TsaE